MLYLFPVVLLLFGSQAWSYQIEKTNAKHCIHSTVVVFPPIVQQVNMEVQNSSFCLFISNSLASKSGDGNLKEKK